MQLHMFFMKENKIYSKEYILILYENIRKKFLTDTLAKTILVAAMGLTPPPTLPQFTDQSVANRCFYLSLP